MSSSFSLGRHKKKIADFAINFIASFLLTATTQLIVYPLLARWTTSIDYGTLLTSVGFLNLGIAFGTALNNARMILDSEYRNKHLVGDFNILLIVLSLLVSIFIFLINYLYLKYDIVTSSFIAFLSIIMVIKQYYVVEFRLFLDFKKIFLCSVFSSIGFFIGLLAFKFVIDSWPLVFIASELLSLIYVTLHTTIWRESFKQTILFKKTTVKTLILLISIFFGTALTYFDRLFLYPTLGSESVSVYTVASYLGKIIAIVLNPISSVLLSYFVQDNFKISRKNFIKFEAAVFIVSLLFALLTFVISPVITSILYPHLFKKAEPYFLIANAASIILVASNLTQTIILKASPTYYQIIKETIYALTYFFLAVLFIELWGLIGFCVAAFIANFIKYVIIFIMGVVTFKDTYEKDSYIV